MESFASLFEESLKTSFVQPGVLIKGTVTRISNDFVYVDAGMKSESAIAIKQFMDENNQLEVAVGDVVDVTVEAIEDGFGETKLSREKAKRAGTWDWLEQQLEANTIVNCMVTGKVKGGLTVDVKGIRGFLPGSLVDTRPVRDFSFLEGKECEVKLVKLDRKRNNVVVSRRAVIEAESSAERDELLKNLDEGSEVKGVVKNLTDYGAFIDLGGIDGLLHITDIAWRRINHPSEVLNVGDEIDVKVLKFDRERNRVSLGMKQMEADPWSKIAAAFPVGSEVSGKVANLTDYGAFVEIQEGVEGLVHTSELDWTNRNIHPSKVVHLGQEVNVKVLDVDTERRRISLSLKQCQMNPWEAFGTQFNKGDKITGKIKSITDFGIFIGLEGGIDGLVHLTDISWNKSGEEAIRDFKKGDELTTIILAIDPERERISLGLKQLEQDPFSTFAAEMNRGSIVSGVVTSVDEKGAEVELAPEVVAYLRASEIAAERVNDARDVLKVGDKVTARVTNLDRKTRGIQISIRAKDEADQQEAMKGFNNTSNIGSNTLGDLLKGQF